MTVRPVTALAATVALATCATVLPLAPAAADPLPSTSGLSALRQDAVTRADRALNTPRSFAKAGSDRLYESRVLPAQNRNVLEHEGSNDNRNVFNDYNGQEWCGYFIAAMWTGQNTPDPAQFPRVPAAYPSSQAWMTDADGRFRAFTGAGQRLPRPGDVLVWTNDSGVGGHVALVVKTLVDTRRVITVEGNVDGDEIARKSYAWDADGPTRDGKRFRGYALRE